MSKLEQLINEFCPNGVEYRRLENCCEILDNKRKPVTKSAREAGKYPYYGANGIQDYVSNYIFDGTFILVGEDGSVVTEMGTPIVTWATGKIWVNNHAHIISEINGVLLRYLFHYLQTVPVKHLIHGNIPKLTGGDFRTLKIAVPPLPVQEEIVRILDKFTELTAELTARKQQYEYYRDNVLNSIQHSKLYPIKDVCDTITNFAAAGSFAEVAKNVPYLSKPDYAQLIRTADIKCNYTHESPIYISKHSYNYLWRVQLSEPCIVLPSVGNCGEVYYIDPKKLPYKYNALAKNALLIRSSKVDLLYLKYTFESFEFQKKLKKVTSNMGQSKFNKTDFEKLTIPIPYPEDKEKSLAEQQRIVDILDRFDKLCNDISEGLPAEIEARQKQYEYYRDKLLTFKKKEAAENE